MEGIIPKTENIVQELLEEDLQREIERNAAANRIAMEREREALAARKRAAESQRMMKEMVTRYETMKKKLDFTKKALQDTNNRIETQERVTAKLDDMKKRLTNYSDRKDALSKKESATDPLDALLTLTEVEEEDDGDDEAEKRQEELKNAMTDHAANVMKLQNKLIEEGDKLKKKAELREWLEKQVELGEQKALEQEKITKEKEDLLKKKEEELQQQKQNKLKELNPQQQPQQQKQPQQPQQQKQPQQQQQPQQPQQPQQQKQLGAKPKQRQKSRSKSKSCTPKLMSPEPVVIDSSKTIPETVETDVSPLDMIKIDGTEDMAVADNDKTVKVEEESVNTEDAESVKINIQETVKKIEGKCATVRGNLADMAMSEQYLRTKQALLLAKKKEKEMEVAETVASLREKEVMKMREKVKQMQDLLNNRKLKLKITEDIMDKKDMKKTGLEKMMENKQERQKHMEKQLIAKKLFE